MNSKRTPPPHLTPESKRLWKAIVHDYEIDQAALMVLAATLEAVDRRAEARAEIAKNGATCIDRFGQLKQSPWTAIERDAACTLMRGFRILGFDQEPRGELGVPRG